MSATENMLHVLKQPVPIERITEVSGREFVALIILFCVSLASALAGVYKWLIV